MENYLVLKNDEGAVRFQPYDKMDTRIDINGFKGFEGDIKNPGTIPKLSISLAVQSKNLYDRINLLTDENGFSYADSDIWDEHTSKYWKVVDILPNKADNKLISECIEHYMQKYC